MDYHLVLPFVNAVIRDDDGRVLVGKHQNLPRKPYPGFWDIPGGKMEANESPEGCLLREVREETGLTVVSCELLGVFHHSGRNIWSSSKSVLPGICICYRVDVVGELIPDELEDMHWASPEELWELKLTPWAAHFLADLL
jgi:8-oxo-dGTP diphosphatase